MLSHQRYKYILDQIQRCGGVKVSDITRTCGVSSETVRRDILYLERQGKLSHVHGGAVAYGGINTTVTIRSGTLQEEKEQIAASALSVIAPGDLIALDCGTTSAVFANHLAEYGHEITVLTHSLSAFNILITNPSVNVIITGGEYNASEEAFCGSAAVDMAKRFHVNKLFLCPSCISAKFGCSEYVMPLLHMQQAYLSIADEVIILADNTKLEKKAFTPICSLEKGYTLITDAAAPKNICALYENIGMRVIRAQ